MKLRLDHTQRLNLQALIGAQRGTSVDEMRLWWRLQDQLELNEEERKQINYRIGKIGDVEQPIWDVDKKLALKEYSFNEESFKRIETLVTEWAKSRGYTVGLDRRWLEPLLDQFEPAKVNGNAATETAISARHSA